MDSKIKRKWIAALCSRKYAQTDSCLKDNNNSFCCLGVLCDIIDQKGWGSKFDGESLYPPHEVLSIAKLSMPSAKRLAKLNDSGYTFKQIAANIKKTLRG